MKISALILTKNEEDMIESCLKQLTFVDEIIVLDQNSKDKTIDIARKYTEKVFETSESDFSRNRMMLKNLAKNDWLLYVDADERFPEKTILEIERLTKDVNYSVFFFPRKNYIMGKWLKHGGWWPDYVPRLFRKDKLLNWIGQIHESPVFEGKSKKLDTPIIHKTARNLSQMFQKSIKWAKIEAELYNRTDAKRVRELNVLKAVFSEFLTRYFIKLGLLDGTVGLIEAIYQSIHKVIVFTYLWEFQNKSGTKKS